MQTVSLEGRANLIGDAVNDVAFVGNPKARREAIRKLALEHLRAAVEAAARHQHEETGATEF